MLEEKFVVKTLVELKPLTMLFLGLSINEKGHEGRECERRKGGGGGVGLRSSRGGGGNA